MFDVPGKGQRGTHGFGIGLHIRLVGFGKPLAKSRPAAHNLDGIVKVQFVPAVSDAGLQGLIDVLFIHRNDQHLVIRKQVTKRKRWNNGPNFWGSSMEKTSVPRSFAFSLLGSA